MSFGERSTPNGHKQMYASLKHCQPNGMPMQDKQKTIPVPTACSARIHPTVIIHRILQQQLHVPQPLYSMSYVILFPKGNKRKQAIFSTCSPQGIPITVAQRTIPTMNQVRNICQPAITSQRKLRTQEHGPRRSRTKVTCTSS